MNMTNDNPITNKHTYFILIMILIRMSFILYFVSLVNSILVFYLKIDNQFKFLHSFFLNFTFYKIYYTLIIPFAILLKSEISKKLIIEIDE
jgi:hypothetical protein